MTHRPTHPAPVRPARRHAGFTLLELLVAIGIIVLMLGLALPAFRTITGGRSEEGAANQVAAMLGRARADALGLQIPRGVAFYTDATGQCRMAEVGAAVFQSWTTSANVNTTYSVGTYVTYTPSGATTPQYYVCIKAVPFNGNVDLSSPTPATWTPYWHEFVDASGTAAPVAPTPNDPTDAYHASDPYYAANGVFYDQLPDTDPVPLPLGVGAQVIADSATGTGTVRTQDAYYHDGVILFDAAGRLVYQSFVLSHYGLLGTAIGLSDSTGNPLNVAINATTSPPLPAATSPKKYAPGQPLPTSFGVVVYDRDAHDNQNFPSHDPTLDATGPGGSYGTVGASPPSPADEEQWLDVNATPLLINRYTGTLVRGG